MTDTGIIILCRYNSNRLPGKIMKKINGKPVLSHIIKQLETVVDKKNIVVATSTQETDNPIEKFCIKENVNIYRGSLDNVAHRFLEAANKYNFKYVTRINGDNFFIDINTLSKMIEIASTGKYDFISNVKNRTFPKGMSIEIVRTEFFENQILRFNKKEYFEHVTLFFYHHDQGQNFYYFYNKDFPEAAGIQLAIDTEDDFLRTVFIYSKLNNKKYLLKNIYKFYKEYYDKYK